MFMPPEKVVFYFKEALKMMNETSYKSLKPVLAATLAALALIVGYIEIVWPLAPWLKLDFSEVVILISFVFLGFNYTLAVIVIRSVIRWLISGHSTNIPFPFFGETVAIVASVVMVLFYMLFSKIFSLTKIVKEPEDISLAEPKSLGKDLLKEFSVGLIITIIMTLVMVGLNFLVVTPSFVSQGEYPFFFNMVNSGKYDRMFGGPGLSNYTIFIVTLYGPFNLVKFASCMAVFTLVKKPLVNALNQE
jgi:riboflavin transporter FmnP